MDPSTPLAAIAVRVDAALAEQGSSLHFAGADWLHRGDRACLVRGVDDHVELACFLHRARLVKGAGLSDQDAARAVCAWLDGGVTAAQLTATVAGLIAEPAAELFERGDHARWYWEMLLASTADDRVIERYKPLIEGILASPLVPTFFPFTTMATLCFSRCPHFPYDAEGMPTVYPRDGGYVAQIPAGDPYQCDTATTVAWLEAVLARHAGEVYLGSLHDRIPPLFDAALAARGSALHTRIEPHGGTIAVVVEGLDGTTVEVRPVRRRRDLVEVITAATGEGEVRDFTGSFEDAAAKVIDWLSGS